MEVQYDGQNAFAAAANGDFPLVVLLWGVAAAARPMPVDLLVATDPSGNTVLHAAASGASMEGVAIVHFLLQQAQASGRRVADVMEAKNQADETPLIRAAHAGNLAVVDALIQQGGADVLAHDKAGYTAAHHAAAEGHLWVLHYLLEAQEQAAPRDTPNVLGGVCCAQNSALHVASARGHLVIAQYLLSRGLDPQQRNAEGTSPIEIARCMQNKPLVKILEAQDRSFSTPPSQCRETSKPIMLLYGAVFFAVLSTSYWAPWWIALPLIIVAFFKSFSNFRTRHRHGHSHNHNASSASANPSSAMHPSKRNIPIPPHVALPANLTSLSKTSTSKSAPSGALSMWRRPRPEMIMGVWVGWVATFSLLLIVVWADPAYSFIRKEAPGLLETLAVMVAALLLVWCRLALLCPSDPGIVRTFQQDIGLMLANAANGVAPPDASHCRTCLVRKPLRSKHCAQCGVCIARMDHHCGWINRCVGYGNHRVFMAFLVLHVMLLTSFLVLVALLLAHFLAPRNLSATLGDPAMRMWMQLPKVLSRHLLVLLVLSWGSAALVAVSAMLWQNLGNAARNLTTNERINHARYAYIDATTSASTHAHKPKLQTRFDRGVASNLAEFWRHKGVDYQTIYDMPSLPESESAGSYTNETSDLQQDASNALV